MTCPRRTARAAAPLLALALSAALAAATAGCGRYGPPSRYPPEPRAEEESGSADAGARSAEPPSSPGADAESAPEAISDSPDGDEDERK